MDLKCEFETYFLTLMLQRAALSEMQAKQAENSHSAILWADISPNFWSAIPTKQ